MARSPSFDREAALGEAIGLFWKRGYHGSSMKQIEQALDMRPGSIYATFGSKDGLYSEALVRYAEAGGRELAEHMTHYDSILSGLKDYLRKIANGCTDSEDVPSRACLIVKTLLESSNTHTGHSDQAREILGAIEQSFSELLEEAKRRGELKESTDCSRLARLLQSQIMGLRSIAERNLSAADLEALGNDMAQILDAYSAK
ncbi:TetR/AcrR family transcriptional regulator [Marinobacter sediminum]|uniref:TetR/AcrR family transcriptional regulator n=1 Tax=Marinobacter sediminum TaxID=256323 RepID=UPI00202EDAB3|nr:TetR/AcrR family transcriptional regulator [Marinobacter sediminum]MCM0614001.1 TetR/AcrR family transcriptional regulator [Marinobacter sediminum]